MALRWEEGRQGTGYRKLLLGRGEHWDLWVIDYPPGTFIPRHVDPVPGRRHWRVNLRLRGEDVYEGDFVWRLGPLLVFRPDVMPHAVRTTAARRLVLSLGFTTPASSRTRRIPT
jgi:hypothetical protein